MTKSSPNTQDWSINERDYLDVSERPVPTVGIQDAPVRCYRVNLQWAKYVAGAMSELLNVKSWQGVDDESHDAIRQLVQMLLGEPCMDCGGVEDCLETSEKISGIESQASAISYIQFGTSTTSTQNFVDDLNTQYDGTPQSIGADIPTGIPDATEGDALCFELEAFVQFYAATKHAQISTKNQLQIAWNRIQNFGNQVFNAVTDLIAPVYSPNLFSCFTSDSEALQVLSHDASLLKLACCLHDELSTVVMSETNWNNALQNCATNLAGGAGDLACLMQNDGSLDLYLMFLHGYQQALERQQAGETLDCNCGGDFWQIEWDFTSGSTLGWTIIEGTVDGANGIKGEFRDNPFPVDDTYQVVIELPVPTGITVDVNLLEFTIMANRDTPGGQGQPHFSEIRFQDDGQTIRPFRENFALTENVPRTHCESGHGVVWNTGTNAKIVIVSSIQASYTDGIWLQQARLGGDGSVPFAPDTEAQPMCS